MITTTQSQNVMKYSNGIAQNPISLLPEGVDIHIASFKKDCGIILFCPFEYVERDGEMGYLFSNGDFLPRETNLFSVIDYPLSTEVEFEVPLSPFLNEMIGVVCEKYKEIYRKEEETSTKKAMPMDEEIPGCGLMNRNFTDGCYGIWGHELDDLYLEGLKLDTARKELILEIGS